MYVKPTLAPLDLATSTASCCRVIVYTQDNKVQVVNEPLCPFPAPTGTICFRTDSVVVTSTGATSAAVCAYPN
jgi:hypothetical protein